MKETLKAASFASNAEQLPDPKGIGMAVAFDLGLTAELLLYFAYHFPSHSLEAKQS